MRIMREGSLWSDIYHNLKIASFNLRVEISRGGPLITRCRSSTVVHRQLATRCSGFPRNAVDSAIHFSVQETALFLGLCQWVLVTRV